ncbi:TIGR03826 family flagellar region protein [Bacillus niameyensis]|uniref:TIGR03826 family flagellar region protein n=1 Tax=Bacillus niameyensis TaxID=1522308 RepID=UPI0007835885|nr:TIGR03826 family flagellar region protein [Bacillus niameyensis]
MDIINCPTCGKIFMKNAVRDVCADCYRQEEADYDRVYQFLRKRENRAATIETVANSTGVEESLLYKWVRRGRLHTTQFPNLGYPCDQCGKIIKKGKLCDSCTSNIKNELEVFDKEQERIENFKKSAYYSQGKPKFGE